MRFSGLAVAGMLACLPPSLAPAAELHCEATGDAAAALCDVLSRTAARSAQAAVLTLRAQDLAPNHLRATLTVLRDGHGWSRGPADLTITDRLAIPPKSIESFASALLKGSGL